MAGNTTKSPILLDTPTEISRRESREVAKKAPSLSSLAEAATLALHSELLQLKQLADGGPLDAESSERLSRAIRAMCSLSKEQRDVLAEQRARGSSLGTEDALRELLDDPAFRTLLMRLLAERHARGQAL
jgi:hypothetical protein